MTWRERTGNLNRVGGEGWFGQMEDEYEWGRRRTGGCWILRAS